MKTALYVYRLAPPVPTGVDRYASELTRALHALHPGRYTLLSSPEAMKSMWVPADLPARRLPGPRRLLHSAWRYLGRPTIDRYAPGANLLHVLVPTFPVPSRMPVVYTIHDVMQLQHPDWFPRRHVELFRSAIRDASSRAAKIVAVSSTVADDLASTTDIERSRIVVVHEGVPDAFRATPPDDLVARTCERYGVRPGGYLIFLGAVTGRKNLVTLLEAIARRGPGAPLLIAGAMGFGSEPVREAIDRLRLTDHVLTPGYVPDADLPPLLAGATALVHPSEYEGFGLTPLEAMSVGTPAIASRAGALPEVLGDAAVLVEPRDAGAWADEITRIESDPQHRAGLAERGRAHAARFTWQRAAAETSAVHDAAVSS